MNVIYTSNELKRAVFETPEERKHYIRGLITHHSVFMLYAPDGVGKSTLSLQMCVEGASGIEVFGGFPIDEQMNVIYIMTERHRYETFERLKLMSTVIDIKWDNIIITDSLQGYNILDHKELIQFCNKVFALSQVFENKGGTQLVYFEPAYALVPHGLISEEGSGALRRLITRIQSHLNCSIGYNHHSNRGIKDINTGKRSKGDMYGSRFISAPCTAIYAVNQTKTGTTFENEKDSLKCLTKKFSLQYNPETYLSYINPDESMKSKTDRFYQILKNYYRLNKEITFDEIVTQADLSHQHARRLLMREVRDGSVTNLKPNGVKALYRVLRIP